VIRDIYHEHGFVSAGGRTIAFHDKGYQDIPLPSVRTLEREFNQSTYGITIEGDKPLEILMDGTNAILGRYAIYRVN